MHYSDLLLQTIQVLVMHHITLHGWQSPVNILTEKCFLKNAIPHRSQPLPKKKNKNVAFCLCESMTELQEQFP